MFAKDSNGINFKMRCRQVINKLNRDAINIQFICIWNLFAIDKWFNRETPLFAIQLVMNTISLCVQICVHSDSKPQKYIVNKKTFAVRWRNLRNLVKTYRTIVSRKSSKKASTFECWWKCWIYCACLDVSSHGKIPLMLSMESPSYEDMI